jgi:hypothetical protein
VTPGPIPEPNNHHKEIPMPETDPLTLATSELPAASKALGGGDEAVTRLAVDFRALISNVTNASARAAGEAGRLHSDDVSNPAGVARQLSELPGRLKADTQDHLDSADVQLDIIEGMHLAAILRHDSRDDANLRFEVENFCAGMTKENAVAAMVALVADPRYATFLAGPAGKSIGARFGFDASILRKVALESLAVNGSRDQVARSAALAAIPQARRVLGLAKAGRDNVAEQVRRAPRRSASAVNALMP